MPVRKRPNPALKRTAAPPLSSTLGNLKRAVIFGAGGNTSHYAPRPSLAKKCVQRERAVVADRLHSALGCARVGVTFYLLCFSKFLVWAASSAGSS